MDDLWDEIEKNREVSVIETLRLLGLPDTVKNRQALSNHWHNGMWAGQDLECYRR